MSERSALRLIPGKDALLEYASGISYNEKTYVEYRGLIYKALVDTSLTFVSGEWELIADLREIRVSDIEERNLLTGSTLTGTTLSGSSIHVPILDNTNVLVLNASGDTQVGVDEFARYNYNQGTASWLLLQIGTGATSASTTVFYSAVLNKPSIISGVTVTAGGGLSGGGSIFGTNLAPYATGGTITVAHADTSSQADVLPTGRTYTQQLKFDTYGHVTGATTSTWTHPDTSSQPTVNNSGYTYIQSVQLDGDGHVAALSSSTWVHPDTSSQASVNNTGSTVIQSIFVDSDGHITGINSAVVSGGGGGINFNVAGDVGSTYAMPNTGILRITGGTNIQTVTTLNGINLGLRINAVPSGLNGQVQYNNTTFGGSSNFVFSAGTSTLRVSNFVLGATPSSGATTDQFITRNSTTGALQRLGFATITRAIAGLPLNAVQYRAANGFSGDSQYIFDPSNKGLTLGTRSGSTGSNSLVVGATNRAFGAGSIAMGSNAKADAAQSFAHGFNVTASNLYSEAANYGTIASGIYSHAEGYFTVASGLIAHAEGGLTLASGKSTHAGGLSDFAGKEVIAGGQASFNHSYNNNSQTVGHGAAAINSAILGGQNHNIEVGNTNAAILGGNAIKLTGTSYVNFAAVSNLAIMTAPTVGIAADDVLVRSSTTGRIRRVTQASLAGVAASPAGVTGSVQIRSAAGTFGSSANLVYSTGTSVLTTTAILLTAASNALTFNTAPVSGTNAQILTRNTSTGVVERIGISAIASLPLNAIQYRSTTGFGGHAEWIFDPTPRAVTLGSRSGTTGTNSFTLGANNRATNTNSIAIGNQSRADGQNAFASGFKASASGNQSHAIGTNTIASGTGSHAQGSGSVSSSFYSHAEGTNTIASNQQAHAEGSSTLASGNASHAEGSNTSATGQSSHAQGGFTKAWGLQSHAEGSGTLALGSNSHAKGTGTKAISTNSYAEGDTTTASGGTSHAEGYFTNAGANGAHAEGGLSKALNIYTHAENYNTRALGQASHAEGNGTVASGDYSHAQGTFTFATGNNSHAGGTGSVTTKQIIAGGSSSFNHSLNNAGQTVGHGALADFSAILGGTNHNIEVGNVSAAIIGGGSIKLTGTSYVAHTAVANLAIMTTPTTGIAADNVLVRSATTGRIRAVTQASISDERLKKNLTPIENVVSKISSLNTYELQYNEKTNEENRFDYGLIAQEVEKLFPHVVKNNVSFENDDTVYKSIEYRKLIPILFAAIKELNDKINKLEGK